MTRLVDKLKTWCVFRRPKDLSKSLLVEWDDKAVRFRIRLYLAPTELSLPETAKLAEITIG